MRAENWKALSSAPPNGTRVCASSELREGDVSCIELSTPKGIFPLIVARKDGVVFGYVNACPHQFLPLNHRATGIVSADGLKLICSMHEAAFDLMSGERLAGPAVAALDPVPLGEGSGEIFITDG